MAQFESAEEKEEEGKAAGKHKSRRTWKTLNYTEIKMYFISTNLKKKKIKQKSLLISN